MATRRPPGEHSWRRYVLPGETSGEAVLAALQWAHCGRSVVMPVRAVLRGLYENQADESAVEILADLRSRLALLKGDDDG